MALLVLFTGTTGARGIAGDLAPGLGVGWIDLDCLAAARHPAGSERLASTRLGGFRGCSFPATAEADGLVDPVDLMLFVRANGVVRTLEAELDVSQDLGDRFTQPVQQRLEQTEGFGLVLVQGVALAEGSELDAAAQMVE